jgi:hypothetical protein
MSHDNLHEAPPRSGSGRRFNYADYLELFGWEFEKFRALPAITAEDLAAADIDALVERLYESTPDPAGARPGT